MTAPVTPAAPAAAAAAAAATRVPLAAPDELPPGVAVPTRAAEGGIAPVPVSDLPTERLEQLEGFYRRNPGKVRTGPIGEALRGALGDVPVVGALARATQPDDVGYGQAIRDQTVWQIESRRQPDNEWWMEMNRGLVSDPLTAEAAVRAGREHELTTNGQRAWATYVKRSDAVKRMLGIDPLAEDVPGPDGTPVPVSTSDAWKGAGLVRRVVANTILMPWARKALWEGHKHTLRDGRARSAEQAASLDARAPKEMEWSSGWAATIDWWSRLSPLATGTQSKIAQQLVLPAGHTFDEVEADLPWTHRAWARVMDAIDPHYEREIAPATAAAAAAAAASS